MIVQRHRARRRGLALAGRHHKLFVADHRGQGKSGAVFRVDIRNATVKRVASGAPLVDPSGLDFDYQRGLLYTTDYSAGPGRTGAIFKVDPGSGEVRNIRKGPPLDEMYGIAFARALFVPAAPDANGDNALFRLGRTGGGLHTYLSPEITEPYGVAIGG